MRSLKVNGVEAILGPGDYQNLTLGMASLFFCVCAYLFGILKQKSKYVHLQYICFEFMLLTIIVFTLCLAFQLIVSMPFVGGPTSRATASVLIAN